MYICKYMYIYIHIYVPSLLAKDKARKNHQLKTKHAEATHGNLEHLLNHLLVKMASGLRMHFRTSYQV